MNSITIIQTYYDDPSFLRQAIEHWKKFTVPVKIILVDDGSEKYPAIDTMEHYRVGRNVSLYAVEENIGFNSHGCRNLGAAVAKTDWLIFLDIDHFISPEDLQKIYHMDLDQNFWYSFKTSHNNNIFPSMNSFMCSKDMFEKGGGYNESWTPHHYGDREFLDMMDSKFQRIELSDIIIQCVRAGRTTKIDKELDKPIYDNENVIMYHPPFNQSSVIQHDKRLNFSWKKLI